MLVFHHWNLSPVRFNTELEQPLMIAFFTSIGFNASTSLLKVGGRQILVFLGPAAGIELVQNVVGIGVPTAFGLPPLFGIITGSVTLMGRPATGMAFAPLFAATARRSQRGIGQRHGWYRPGFGDRCAGGDDADRAAQTATDECTACCRQLGAVACPGAGFTSRDQQY